MSAPMWDDWVDEAAVAIWEKAALEGSVYAAWELMQIYCGPSGNELPGPQRLARLLPLCQRGYPEAQRTLAQMYQRGDGIPRDMAQALHWYRQSAGQGYAEAQCELADLYYEGEEVERNLPEAFRLYTLAAQKRHDFAELGLAMMYEAGDGVARNMEEAIYWYARAAECRQVTMAAAQDKLVELGRAYPEAYDRAWDRYCQLPLL